MPADHGYLPPWRWALRAGTPRIVQYLVVYRHQVGHGGAGKEEDLFVSVSGRSKQFMLVFLFANPLPSALGALPLESTAGWVGLIGWSEHVEQGARLDHAHGFAGLLRPDDEVRGNPGGFSER